MLLIALILIPTMTRAEDVLPFCKGCELSIGMGGTYRFWSRTHGIVAPVGIHWSGDRYELGVFRMTTAQLAETLGPPVHRVADPYWAASLSRRWQLWGAPQARLFYGFGVSYKVETDELNSTHWNFAQQLGLRFRLSRGPGSGVELCVRHWSNAGIKLPNRGQDFFTLTYVF